MKSNDITLKALICAAVYESENREYLNTPALSELNKRYGTSDSLDNKVENIVKEQKRSDDYITFKRTLKKVSIYVLICISLTFGSLMTASAVRESVVHTFLEWHNKFTRVFVISDIVPQEISDVLIEYLPQGFELTYSDSSAATIKIFTYQKDDQYMNITLTLSDENQFNDVDNERMDYYELEIAGNKGIWLNSGVHNIIIISKEGITYKIEGVVPLIEIVKVYENMKIM